MCTSRTLPYGWYLAIETSILAYNPHSAHHVVAYCSNLWHYSNHKQMPSTDFAYYGIISIRGVVNGTTSRAHKRDVHVTSIVV